MLIYLYLICRTCRTCVKGAYIVCKRIFNSGLLWTDSFCLKYSLSIDWSQFFLLFYSLQIFIKLVHSIIITTLFVLLYFSKIHIMLSKPLFIIGIELHEKDLHDFKTKWNRTSGLHNQKVLSTWKKNTRPHGQGIQEYRTA